MNKWLLFCIFVLAQSCQIKTYTSLPKLLNKCKGYAVVTHKAHNHENYRKFEHYTMIVADSTGKFRQFKGGNYGCVVGDTLLIKTNR